MSPPCARDRSHRRWSRRVLPWSLVGMGAVAALGMGALTGVADAAAPPTPAAPRPAPGQTSSKAANANGKNTETKKTETKKAETKKAETKAGDKKAETKAGDKKTETKAGDKKTEAKGDSKNDNKNDNKKAETKVGEKRRAAGEEVPPPADDDRDRERIRRLQATIGEILHNRTLGRLRVGLRVISARTGRLYYGRSADVLMDPASNQKVLATTAALMRLGGDWRFRTEISAAQPDGDGVIAGPVRLRGSGDPSLHMTDLEDMAARLRARGVVRIDGGVMADSRRLGDDGASGGRDDEGALAPLIVDRGVTVVRVRPGDTAGAPAIVVTYPAQPAGGEDGRQGFVIRNQAVTKEGLGRPKVSVRVSVVDGRLRVDVGGKVPLGSSGAAFRRRVPHPALHAAVLLRAALLGAGISVRDSATMGVPAGAGDLVIVHESAPLQVVLRKINKDSDNDQAERVLQAVGAEQRGGAATTAKGLVVLRDVIGSLGLPPTSYVPKNGSGLGHENRITAHAMADLLRALYRDPRVGPEILQSLSVGGIDGTTRNRFKGTLAARRVRAKTGTLNGKSCLSGLVGDGDDLMVFSMMVQGFRGRNLPAVRAAQVGAVTALMRYVREGTGERIDLPPGFEERDVGRDVETGGEVFETGEEGEGEGDGIMPLAGEPVRRPPGEDSAETLLRQSRAGGPAPGAPALRPAVSK
ncbi:MAG: D-alanyl-D-alanine carboxypeptidase/D-alanyl-D-alanine-endopeptidase [Bacteroidota bacterium]